MSNRNPLYFSMRRRNENQDQWLRRTAPAYEHNSQSRGLSGHPNKQGVKKEPGRMFGEYEVVRIGYGRRASFSVEAFALRNGLDFLRYNGNGCSGMCERLDGIAFKGPHYLARLDVYNNDTH